MPLVNEVEVAAAVVAVAANKMIAVEIHEATAGIAAAAIKNAAERLAKAAVAAQKRSTAGNEAAVMKAATAVSVSGNKGRTNPDLRPENQKLQKRGRHAAVAILALQAVVAPRRNEPAD